MNEVVKMHSFIKMVALGQLRVYQPAQRILKPANVNQLLVKFDPELLGHPVVSSRDGYFYIIDGQHRFEALKKWLGKGWESQRIECRVYVGMTPKEEAKMFRLLSRTLAISAMDNFRVGITAGSDDEIAITKEVESVGIVISQGQAANAVSCVSTLMTIYKRSDGKTLGRALKLVHESFGAPGLTQFVIDGAARMCQRYNGELDDAQGIETLRELRGGVGAVI